MFSVNSFICRLSGQVSQGTPSAQYVPTGYTGQGQGQLPQTGSQQTYPSNVYPQIGTTTAQIPQTSLSPSSYPQTGYQQPNIPTAYQQITSQQIPSGYPQSVTPTAQLPQSGAVISGYPQPSVPITYQQAGTGYPQGQLPQTSGIASGYPQSNIPAGYQPTATVYPQSGTPSAQLPQSGGYPTTAGRILNRLDNNI